MNHSNNILLDKLDTFIRKYYKNQLIRGLIYFVAGAASLFLVTSLLEYFGRFNSGVRTVLFFVFVLFSLGVLIKLAIIPLLKLYKMGERINHQQAALIVGAHFPDIGDKLLNTLQLGNEADIDNSLLNAAIAQKTNELKPVPFQQAIDLKANWKYAKYAIAPLAILLLVILVAPGFTESSKRIVNYNKEFLPQAPFSFHLENPNLKVIQNEDYFFKLKTEGEIIPADVYVEIDGQRFKMRSEEPGHFNYLLKRLSDDVDFKFEAEGFYSEEFKLQVLAKPSLLDFSAYLDFPTYTGLKDEEFKNMVDFQVPAGTKISWKFNARNAKFMKANKLEGFDELGRDKDQFKYSAAFKDSRSLKVFAGNDEVALGDSLHFSIQVIPDEFPQINMEERADSLSSKVKYLLGEISDDYGFSKLNFVYRFVYSDNQEKMAAGAKNIAIAIDKRASIQNYYHYWDLKEMNIEASDKVEYYFEVWDNDAVNGAKSSRSISQVFEAPNLDKINAETEKTNEKIKNELADNKKEMKELNKDLLELERKMTEKKEIGWEEKKKIKELIQEHRQMEKSLEKMIEEQKKNNIRESEFKEVDQNIKEKQQDLEKLFEEVLDEETKKLLEEIERLMEQNRKEELMEKLDQMQFNDKEIEKQMDRMLEQLKQLQLEKKVDETVEKLNKLAEKQQKLSEKTLDKEKDKEELTKEQEKLEEEFKKVEEDLKDIDKKNKELETPLNMDPKSQEEKQEKVGSEQKESKENLKKNKRNDASENQQNAAEEMKKMAKEMEEMMEQAMQEQEGEDYNKLREILENLVQVSKDQEDLMEEFKIVQNYNPRYVELGQIQKKIKDDTRMIEDSLLSLSMRVKEIEHFVNKEIGKVNLHMGKTIEELGERRTREVTMHQQYVMTSMNNLALMLSESLAQMQQQMQAQKPGSGSCKKPGDNKKPGEGKGMKGMKEMQESLKKQLEEMHNGMQKGEKPGSKEFAEAAAMQAAIRKKLRDLKAQLEKEGKGNKLGNLGQTEEMMDDLEQDLYNKRMGTDVMKRQQEILTRLLEHEKAERQQEQDEQRKANEGQDFKRILPPSIEEYLKQKEKEQELLRSLPPDLSPYYKRKVREYFKTVD